MIWWLPRFSTPAIDFRRSQRCRIKTRMCIHLQWMAFDDSSYILFDASAWNSCSTVCSTERVSSGAWCNFYWWRQRFYPRAQMEFIPESQSSYIFDDTCYHHGALMSFGSVYGSEWIQFRRLVEDCWILFLFVTRHCSGRCSGWCFLRGKAMSLDQITRNKISM